VTDYSREETAGRAGQPTEFVDRLVALGMIVPAEGDRFTAADSRKVGIIKSLEDAGIPLEAVAESQGQGVLGFGFVESPVYEGFSPYTRETFAQLSQRTGVPVDLLMVIREAIGSALPSLDDFVREDEMAIVPYITVQLEEGIRPVAIERMLRVHGDLLGRLADAEAAWWRDEIVVPRMEAGMAPEEVAASVFSTKLSVAAEDALRAIWHARQAHGWTGNIIEGFEVFLRGSGLYDRLERPPAMCFLDITGYTRLTEERGDQAAAELAGELSRLVQRTSVRHAGRPVKWLGDGVMFFFPRPGAGVVAALDMVEGVVQAGLPPAHVGLHAGPVLFQQGDYFGQTVNVASRIAEYARPGEVLVSQQVVDEASAEPAGEGVRFADIGPVELKGVAGAMHLHAVHRA